MSGIKVSKPHMVGGLTIHAAASLDGRQDYNGRPFYGAVPHSVEEEQIRGLLRGSFAAVDRETTAQESSGSTASVVYISGIEHIFYTATVGNSPIMVCEYNQKTGNAKARIFTSNRTSEVFTAFGLKQNEKLTAEPMIGYFDFEPLFRADTDMRLFVAVMNYSAYPQNIDLKLESLLMQAHLTNTHSELPQNILAYRQSILEQRRNAQNGQDDPNDTATWVMTEIGRRRKGDVFFGVADGVGEGNTIARDVARTLKTEIISEAQILARHRKAAAEKEVTAPQPIFDQEFLQASEAIRAGLAQKYRLPETFLRWQTDHNPARAESMVTFFDYHKEAALAQGVADFLLTYGLSRHQRPETTMDSPARLMVRVFLADINEGTLNMFKNYAVAGLSGCIERAMGGVGVGSGRARGKKWMPV